MIHRYYNCTFSKMNFCLLPLGLILLNAITVHPIAQAKVLDSLQISYFSHPIPISADCPSISFLVCSILTICTSTILLPLFYALDSTLCSTMLLHTSVSQPPPGPPPPSLLCSVPCEIDFYELDPQASLSSDFWLGSFNGKLRKEIGAVWRVNSGVIVGSFLSLLSLQRQASCLCQRPQPLSGNFLRIVTSLRNTPLVPFRLCNDESWWLVLFLDHCTVPLIFLNCIKASVNSPCISISSHYSVQMYHLLLAET